jgi:hypothetical protein
MLQTSQEQVVYIESLRPESATTRAWKSAVQVVLRDPYCLLLHVTNRYFQRCNDAQSEISINGSQNFHQSMAVRTFNQSAYLFMYF